MATSSIFNSLNANDEESCRRLVDAMDDAVKARPKKITLSHRAIEPDEKQLRELVRGIRP